MPRFLKKINKSIFPGVMFFLISFFAFPQNNTLFDDNRLSSIYITIAPDSLAVIMTDILSDHYYMARFIFDDTRHRDTLENIGFRLRGNTSRYAQKKSFKISFNEYVSGRKYQGVKKINLNGEHNDPTLIREKLYYDIWKKAGMVERRTNFMKLYINNQYFGLYTNLEEMEKEWLSSVYDDKDGNLYKCTYPADLVYLGNDPQTYKDLENSTVTGGRVYELQTNKSADDYTRLVQLITTLDRTVDSEFAANIDTIVNTGHFLKALALDVAMGNWDNYSFNKNNFYLYDNPSDKRFDFITYDPDNNCGIDWFGIDWGNRDCRDWINRSMDLPLAQKLLAVPDFFIRYKQFLDTIANTIIHPDSIFPRIDALKQQIQQAAEADTYRTLDYGYSIADFNNSYNQALGAHVKYGLKPFFTTRKESISRQLHPEGLDDGGRELPGLTIYPNPAREEITIKSPEPGLHMLQYRIVDVFGKTHKEVTGIMFQDGKCRVAVNDLPAGIYLLMIEVPGKIFSGKFIRE